MVRLALFRDRSYSVGALTVLFFFAGYPGMLLLAQLYLQRGLHESAFAAAATSVPFGLASSLTAVFSGWLVHRFGRWTVVAGTFAVTVGVGLTAFLVSVRLPGDAAFVLIVPFVLSGLGSGLIIAPNQTLAMAQVSRSEGSTAAGVYQVAMRIGQSIGVPLALTLYSSGLLHGHGNVFKAASSAMTSSAVLVGLALVIRLGDILWRRHRTQVHPTMGTGLGAMAGATEEPGG
jgi:MFS family permease